MNNTKSIRTYKWMVSRHHLRMPAIIADPMEIILEVQIILTILICIILIMAYITLMWVLNLDKMLNQEMEVADLLVIKQTYSMYQ